MQSRMANQLNNQKFRTKRDDANDLHRKQLKARSKLSGADAESFWEDYSSEMRNMSALRELPK